MGRIGFWEIGIVLVILLLLFGPGRLPRLVKSIGESIKEFKKALTGEGEKKRRKKE